MSSLDGTSYASVALIQRALARLDAAGHPRAEVVARVGLQDVDLDDPLALLPLHSGLAIYQLGAQLLDDPAFGVSLASTATSSTYGLPGLLLRHHATLGEGLAAGCATLATLIPALVIEIEAVQDDVVYRFVPRTDAPGIDLFGHDLVAGMVVCGREVTAEDWAPAAIDLHGSRLQPVHLEPFRQVLGTMPTVSDAPSSVRIRARDLQLPVPTADPTVLAHLHEAVAAQVRKRRTVARHGGVIQLQDAVVDLELGQVVRDGRSTPLTPREVQVLRVLSAHPNQVVTHEQLEQAVWTTDRWEISHAPAVTVRRLRAKLEQDPSVPVNLITVFGEGWTLRVREGSS